MKLLWFVTWITMVLVGGIILKIALFGELQVNGADEVSARLAGVLVSLSIFVQAGFNSPFALKKH